MILYRHILQNLFLYKLQYICIYNSSNNSALLYTTATIIAAQACLTYPGSLHTGANKL